MKRNPKPFGESKNMQKITKTEHEQLNEIFVKLAAVDDSMRKRYKNAGQIIEGGDPLGYVQTALNLISRAEDSFKDKTNQRNTWRI